MIGDFRHFNVDGELRADICIIGAGPVGISAAAELAEHTTQTILLLEAGGLEPEDVGPRGHSRSVGLPYSVEETRRRAIGGTSRAWNAERGALMRPFEAIDFAERDWVPESGWPFGSGELLPHYRRASEVLGLPTAAQEVIEDGDPSLQGLALDSRRLRNVPIYHVSMRYFSQERVAALPDRVQLWHHADVVDLRMDANGRRVTSALVRRQSNGPVSEVRAAKFIVAAGAVENARLLLASASGRGVGNPHGLVGRYFMEHPKGECGLFVPRSPEVVSKLAPYAHHLREDLNVRFHIYLAEQAIRDNRILGMYAALWPTEPDWLGDDLRDLAIRILGEYGPSTPVYAFSFQLEQAPLAENRVSLEQDQAGHEMLRLDWQLSPLEHRTLVRGMQIIQEEFFLIGAGSVLTKPYLDESGGYEWNLWRGYPYSIKTSHHPMGTTRMHLDPQKGVVDADCRVHGVENLFMAGCSVFPTGSHMNPTFTAVAMALRLARHLIDNGDQIGALSS
jgi:choline dehydrogenase-like flavoprotein